jgi:hypothetical protein
MPGKGQAQLTKQLIIIALPFCAQWGDGVNAGELVHISRRVGAKIIHTFFLTRSADQSLRLGCLGL